MKKFSEQVLAPHKHMSKKASPYHPHSQGLVYTPKGKEEVRPIDTADAGYGGEAVADAEGGDANPGKASKKAVAPMKMQTLVKANEGFDSSPADIAKMLVAKHGKNVTRDHIKALEQDRDSHSGLDHEEIMQHVKKLQEETERERLMRLRSFAAQQRHKGLGKAMVEEDQIDEMEKDATPPGRDGGSYIPRQKPKPIKLSPGQKEQSKDMTRQLIDLARTRLGEEVEQVDELNKSTLSSYMVKSMSDMKKQKRQVDIHTNRAARVKHAYTARGNMDVAGEYQAKVDKRAAGIGLAAKKLAREEVEQVDELKKSTLASYAKKATDDVSYHSFMAGTMSAKDPNRLAQDQKAMKRQSGVIKAVDKLTKEEVTDYNPKSQGGTRSELLAKLAKSKSSEHATAARKAGATQSELKAAMMKEENDGTEADAGEYGYEGDMAMSQLKSIIRNAQSLHDHMEPQTDLPEWLQAKLTLAADYIQTASDYWKSEKEEAVSEAIASDECVEEGTKEVASAVRQAKGIAFGKRYKAGNYTGAYNAISKLGKKHGIENLPSHPEVKSALERANMEEEVWDKPMPDSAKKGSLSPEQKAKAKARADRAGRTYPNMIDNMWASKQ